MAEKTQIGLYWGKDSFSFVEAEGKQASKLVHIPFDKPLPESQSQDVPQSLRLTALIQKAVAENKFSSTKVNLSLTTNDLIFRSFVIPWMQPNEVKNVVDFEATKYIPIPLENLVYTYHSIFVTENNQKNLRILFVAVRKDTLEKYAGILEQAGLQVGYTEPAFVSFVRALAKHGHISQNHSHAIIEIGQEGGRIIIVDHDAVHFVREFQTPEDMTDTALLSAKLFNDIRVSFSFYARQNPQAKVDKVIVVTAENIPDLSENLSKEFGKPVTMIPASSLFKKDLPVHIGLVPAYGMALREKAFSSKNFELSTTAGVKPENVPNYKIVAGVAAACFLIIYATAVLTNKLIVVYRQKIEKLEAQQGLFRSMEPDAITAKKDETLNTITSYKAIRLKSGLLSYLTKIPKTLSPGTWIKSLTLEYSLRSSPGGGTSEGISKISIDLNGYAYLKNPNEQFRVVNALVAKFKEDKDFSSSFEKIDYTMQGEKIDEYTVTSFRITCK